MTFNQVSEAEIRSWKDKEGELLKQIELAQAKARGEAEHASRVEKELLKKIQATTPFLNMKRMLKEKNDQLKSLRVIVAK